MKLNFFVHKTQNDYLNKPTECIYKHVGNCVVNIQFVETEALSTDLITR